MPISSAEMGISAFKEKEEKKEKKISPHTPFIKKRKIKEEIETRERVEKNFYEDFLKQKREHFAP